MKKTTVSDTSKAIATASGTAINGTQTLEISQLAKTAYVTGGKLADNITGSSSLNLLGIKTGAATGNGVIQVRTATKTTNIEVDSTMTINQLVSKFNEAGVQANFDDKNHRFYVSSTTSGKDGDFSISANNTLGLTSLIKLGLLTDKEIDGIKTASTGSEYVKKSFTVGSGEDAFSYTKSADEIKTLLTSIKAAKAKDEADRTDDEKKLVQLADYLDSKYAASEYEVTTTTPAEDEGGEDTVTTTKYKFGSEGKIDWDTIADDADKLNALVNQIYNDSEYDETAQTETSREITEAVNAVRDKYVALAKANAMPSETADEQAAKSAAIGTAQSELEDILNPETHPTYAKWASYIETNFGSQNSQGDTSYSNFWTQSDNLDLSKSVFYRVDLAANIANNNTDLNVESEAIKINGQDSIIKLNGVEYTSSNNAVTVNGLTVEAMAVTEENAPINITVTSDTDGLYDKIKDFLNSYNNLITEMQKLYNADSAKDYEPLTDDEKAEMSETEIEKWEQKIKDSLLRRDSSLSGLISTMTLSMMKTYQVNGKTYAWSSFGVHTLGTMNSAKNENYNYHIDGDSEDSKTSGNKDQLKAALAEDPESVIEFLKQVTSGLYADLDKKMKSTAVKSVYTVYNDKEMASEYSNYTDLINEWSKRVTDMEDSYYKKFSKMESALAKLQSNSSSLTSMLGGG